MVNVGDVGDHVRAAEHTVDEAHETVDIATNRFAQARGLLHLALVTSRRLEPRSAIEALTAAIAHAEAAAVHCAEATTRLDEWLDTAGVPRRSTSPVSAGPHSEHGDVSIPEAVRRLSEGLRPWRPKAPVRARILDGEEDLTSGKNLQAADGLKPEYASRVVVTDHAEGHLAERMRRPGARRHETIIVNKRPCPGDLGCDRTLPHIIPKGATVTVYVVAGDGLGIYRTYRGTGEGIA